MAESQPRFVTLIKKLIGCVPLLCLYILVGDLLVEQKRINHKIAEMNGQLTRHQLAGTLSAKGGIALVGEIEQLQRRIEALERKEKRVTTVWQ
jgi:signal transduction histidine kinase